MGFIEKTAERKVIQEHSLDVDGTRLVEKKVVTTHFTEGSKDPVTTEKIHTRSIGDRVYTEIEVQDSTTEPIRSVETSLKDEEVKAFLEEWKLKWNPEVAEPVIHAGAFLAHDEVVEGEQANDEGQEEEKGTDEQKPEDEQEAEAGKDIFDVMTSKMIQFFKNF